MSVFGTNASAAFARAADRARKILQPGDRVTLGSSCGGATQTVTFAHFSDHRGMPDIAGKTFSSRSLDDLAPWNITKVNGQEVNFRDEEGQKAVDLDRAMFAVVQVQSQRATLRMVRP